MSEKLKRPCQYCNGTGEETNPVKLGAELRSLRVSCGLLLKEMAETLGISQAYLSDMEHGKRQFHTDTIKIFKAACARMKRT